MNENEMNNEMQQVTAPVQEQVTVQQEAPVIPEVSEKRGMTKGQKMAGLGLIGFAIAGIVWLVMSVVKGIKKLVAKIKTPKEAPAQQVAASAPAPAVTQEPAPAAPQQEVQQAAAPEQK